LVPRLDPAASSGTVGIDAVCGEVAAVFDPPDSIIRDRRFQLRIEIDAGKYNRSYCQQEQQNGYEADLAFPIHGLRRPSSTWNRLDRRKNGIAPIINEQLRCHEILPLQEC
jgi:hypothetical protein